jgi:hypothetical protein
LSTAPPLARQSHREKKRHRYAAKVSFITVQARSTAGTVR